MTAHDDAVKAAAEVLCEPRCRWRVPGLDAPCGFHTTDAEAAVAAAAPHLLAPVQAEVERIAQAIDQAWAEAKDRDRHDGGYRDGYLDGLEFAEGIARSTPLHLPATPTTEETR